MEISKANVNFEREPLTAPFGFKGGYASEIWQSVVALQGPDGSRGIGLGTQSVLWSDAAVFSSLSEAAGNALMLSVTEYASGLSVGIRAKTPVELLHEILPQAFEYAKRITNNPGLRLTFVLNALVAFDNAAWMLYARQNAVESFDTLIPLEFRQTLPCRHQLLAAIPLITYGVPIDDLKSIVQSGYFLLKVKIGADPDGNGDQDTMLAWDQERLKSIHTAIGHLDIPNSPHGKAMYYLDANGRYNSKERLRRFLDHAEKIGAFDRIFMLEEPFAEEAEIEVGDLGVRVVADESAHCADDVIKRIQMGYGAVALKPIAKTLSVTLEMLQAARSRDIPCFCADLTVNPILVDWNKNVAARIAPMPGMNIGLLESNGSRNYKRWDEMLRFHPRRDGTWINPRHGMFHLDESFYSSSGAILEVSEHYEEMVKSLH